MKKSPISLLSVSFLLALTGCGTTTSSESSFDSSIESLESFSSQEISSEDSIEESSIEEKEFSFNSDLPEKGPLYPLSHDGKTYYVANNGSDSNDGLSEDKPLATLEKASTLTLNPGDQILFKCGDTFVGHLSLNAPTGITSNPITVASYGETSEKNRPILRNLDEDDYKDIISIYRPSNFVIRDLEVHAFAPTRQDMNNAGNAITGINIQYNFMRDVKCKNVYVINNVVKGNGVDSNIMGITIGSNESSYETSPSKVLTNGYVCYNRVSNVGRSGIHCSGWVSEQQGNNNEGRRDKYINMHFDHNVVENVGCIGIYPMDVTRGTCNYNIVSGTGLAHASSSTCMEGECGIMSLCAEDYEIKFNDISGCKDQNAGYDAMGIDIDWNTNNIDVQYNYCHDNQGAGIGTMANQNCFIRNNILVNNEGDTNQPGSICISNFTSRYVAVPDDWHDVDNLMIDSNLIHHFSHDTPVFNVHHSNGDKDFDGNQFVNNHCYYMGEDESSFKWINVTLPWYKFANNSYYSESVDTFVVSDNTAEEDINTSEGARPYLKDDNYSFDAWKVRDLGSTFEQIDSSKKIAKLSNFDVKYNGLELTISFDNDDGEFWHANVYKVESEDENPCLQNMIGESKENNVFTYIPEYKETAYYILQVENDIGNFGEEYFLKIVL